LVFSMLLITRKVAYKLGARRQTADTAVKLPQRTSTFQFPFSSFPLFLFHLLKFPFISSPLLFLLGLALISRQDDAVETIKERHARFPLPEIYGLWETVVLFIVCGREQFAPPLFRPET
jgi:hypothetical protein